MFPAYKIDDSLRKSMKNHYFGTWDEKTTTLGPRACKAGFWARGGVGGSGAVISSYSFLKGRRLCFQHTKSTIPLVKA